MVVILYIHVVLALVCIILILVLDRSDDRS